MTMTTSTATTTWNEAMEAFSIDANQMEHCSCLRCVKTTTQHTTTQHNTTTTTTQRTSPQPQPPLCAFINMSASGLLIACSTDRLTI